MASIMEAVKAGIALVKNPAGFMQANKDTPKTVREIMINYVAVLAAIPFFATLIGDLWYFGLFSRYASYFIGYAFVSAVMLYILDVIAVYVISIVIRMLASNFGSSTDPIKALKLSAYVYATPAFLAAVVFIIPPLGIVAFLGLLYGLYILYLGLPIVLGTPKDKVIPYVFATVVAVVIVYLVFGLIISIATAAFFFAGFGSTTELRGPSGIVLCLTRSEVRSSLKRNRSSTSALCIESILKRTHVVENQPSSSGFPWGRVRGRRSWPTCWIIHWTSWS